MFIPHDFLNMQVTISNHDYKNFLGYNIKKPKWLLERPNDSLNIVYDNLENFYQNGEVFLSCIIVANVSLFRQISGDKPAQMLYTNDEFFFKHPEKLLDIAKNIYELNKSKDYDTKECQEFVELVLDDFKRVLNIKVPSSLTDNHDVWTTTILVYREHIPFHKLSNYFYPLIIDKDKSVGGMIVPKWFWSKNFRRVINFTYDNVVRPKMYSNLPVDYKNFFKPFVSGAFFKEHPIYYIFFSILQIISFFTPLNMYCQFCDYIRTVKGIDILNSDYISYGVLGTLLISCAFVNVIWSFMDKYLGNKVTIGLAIFGILLIVISTILILY